MSQEEMRKIIVRQGKTISLLIASLRDISRQPEGDEQSAQAVARETLNRLEDSGMGWYTKFEEGM